MIDYSANVIDLQRSLDRMRESRDRWKAMATMQDNCINSVCQYCHKEFLSVSSHE